MYDRHLFTSESVTEGHPDKVADAISDAVLDAILKDDPRARVACETLVTTGLACVAGEITTTTYVSVPDLVRSTIELAHSLGLRVVAEGVESEDILERLTALGCDLAQGYCLSRPVPAEELSGSLTPAARSEVGARKPRKRSKSLIA